MIVGIEYQPMAKLGSVVVTLTTFVYEYATTKLKKMELFHLVSSVFGLIFLILSALLSDPVCVAFKLSKKAAKHHWLALLFHD